MNDKYSKNKDNEGKETEWHTVAMVITLLHVYDDDDGGGGGDDDDDLLLQCRKLYVYVRRFQAATKGKRLNVTLCVHFISWMSETECVLYEVGAEGEETADHRAYNITKHNKLAAVW